MSQSGPLAPTYMVVSTGLTPDQASRLAAALQITVDPAAGPGFFYLDPARFMVVPTLVTADLVHYAPPLAVPAATILPHCRCGGTAPQPGGPVARLKSHYFPASRPALRPSSSRR